MRIKIIALEDIPDIGSNGPLDYNIITKGRIYDAEVMKMTTLDDITMYGDMQYKIITDTGSSGTFPCRIFKTLQKDREEKIDKLLK